jgi:N4-gp56 family major capsid protein
MAITTTSVISAPVNNVFQQTLLRNAKANCPYFAGSTPAEISEHQGTFTAKWRRIENLTPVTTALAELVGSVVFPTRQEVQPSITDVTATVSKFGNFIFLNEEVDLVNFTGQTDKLMEVLGINAGQSLNRLQRNVLEDNFTAILGGSATTATGISGVATASGFIKRSDIANLNNTLNRNIAMRFTPQTTGSQNIGSTPIRASFLGICHPDTEEDLRTLTGFNSVETYAGQIKTYDGEIGHVGGVRFISTPESSIDVTTGTGATSSATTAGRSTATRYDVYNTPVYGQDAVGSVGFAFEHIKETYMAGDKLPGVQVISKARGSAGAADPLNELGSIGWKSWYAGVVLNSAWGRTLRHSSSLVKSNE